MTSPLKFKAAPLATATLALIGVLLPSGANAIPAFARQTEQPCVTCHVGAFGPQLTDYGRDFKMNGYVWGKEDVKPWEQSYAGKWVTGGRSGGVE